MAGKGGVGTRAFALLVTAAVCAGAPAFAQVRAEVVLGRDDAQFAAALQQANYPDLCGVVLELMKEAGAASGPSVEATLLGIRLSSARAESDPGERRKLLNGLVTEAEAFLERYPESGQAAELRNTLPDVYQALGESFAAELAAAVQDIGASAEIRKEAQDTFEKAEARLDARVKELRDKLSAATADGTEQPDESLVVEHMVASYALARVTYFHALIEAEGSFEREQLLESALEKLQEFDLDYEDRLMNIEARVYQALCMRDMGNQEDALETLDTALAVREAFGRDGNGPWKLPPDAADYVSVAARQKVIMLTQFGQPDKAVEAARDYLATTPEALQAAQGKAVMYEMAQAQIAASDTAGAQETLKQLIEADQGYWRRRAQVALGDILGGRAGGGDLSAKSLLAVAETLAGSGNPSRAVPVCMRALDAARGTPEEASVGCDAYMIVGSIYARAEDYLAAAVAFDAAQESYPDAPNAPDALWKAITCYIELRGTDKRDYYRKQIDDRMKRLLESYPSHPRAADVQLVEARQLEAAKEWAQAADAYLKVRSESAAYAEAQLRGGNSLYQESRRLSRAGDSAGAAAAAKRAVEVLSGLSAVVQKRLAETLDSRVQTALRSFAFDGALVLVSVYLTPEIDRSQDALAVLSNLDREYGDDQARSTRIWEYRIRTLESLGKLDDATGLLDALIASKDAGDRAAGPAGLLATKLDTRATEMVKAQGKITPQALDLWRKAARYYGIALLPQIAGRTPLRPADANAIAVRLYAIGLIVNNIPEGIDSFSGIPKLKVVDTAIWEQAAAISEAVLAAIPSTQAAVYLGRVHGLLGRWKEAETTLSRLFSTQQILDPETSEIDQTKIANNGLLLPAYLDWGVANFHLGEAEPGSVPLTQSHEILRRVRGAAERGGSVWWRATYWTLRALMANGNYDEAVVLLNGLDRTFSNFDDNKYGLAELFKDADRELTAKGVK